ncbi:hypothetical protein EV175_004760 [Coemansia sp. RSA 1933]|nr:hypothetical protein EV175_004760 [Coemansia sp. RSA 1933]
MRPSSKQAATMREMLSTAGDASISPRTMRVARKRTRLSGQAVIDFTGTSAIPEDQPDDPYVGPFVWVVVQSADAEQIIAAAYSQYKASHMLFLPSLEDRRHVQLSWAEKYRKNFNRTVRDFADKWQLSAQGQEDTQLVLETIRGIFRTDIRKITASIDVYGSRFYGVCSEASDVDIAIDVQRCPAHIENPRQYVMSTLVRMLTEDLGFTDVLYLRNARVPIIRFKLETEPGRTVSGEISAHGRMGCAKSRLIAAYIKADPRVRQVLALLKTWSIGRKIHAPLALNWHGLIIMAITYLIKQHVVPPLQLLNNAAAIDRSGWAELKALHESPDAIDALYRADEDSLAPIQCLQSSSWLPVEPVDGCRTYFASNANELAAWRSPNQLSAIRLLHDMFKFYGYAFDPLAHVVSLRLGSPLIPRSSLHKLNAPDPRTIVSQGGDLADGQASGLRTLAIEDPFEVTLNCARHAPSHWVDGLLWEMRRAAWAISRKSPYNGPYTAIDRMALQPSVNHIYCHAAVWAPAVAAASPFLFDKYQRTGSLRKVFSLGSFNDRLVTEKLKIQEDTDLELAGQFKFPTTTE